MLLPRNAFDNTTDLSIVSITWGFTLGFGFLTGWTAVKQTRHMWKRRNGNINHPYVWMIWGELFSCLALSIVCWLVLQGVWSLNLASLFIILSLWVIQVHFLFQIIINRVAILMVNRRRVLHLKVGVAVLISLVNVTVFCIWIPAKLGVSKTYERINVVWDRIEKVIILLVDAGLNYYFIQTVQKCLIKPGLTKYRPLVRFNQYMILLSLAMDALIIGMLSLKNPLVYLMFHPLAYTVKLKIEMSMAELIAKVARIQDRSDVHFNNHNGSSGYRSEGGTITTGKGFTSTISPLNRTNQSKRESGFVSSPDLERGDIELRGTRVVSGSMSQANTISEDGASDTNTPPEVQLGFVVHRHDVVHMEVESAPSEHHRNESDLINGFDARRRTQDSDETPLRKEVNKIGVETKVWGHHY